MTTNKKYYNLDEDLNDEHVRITKRLKYEDGTVLKKGETGTVVKDSSVENMWIIHIEEKPRNYDVPRDSFIVLRGYKELDDMNRYISEMESFLKFLKGDFENRKKKLDKKYHVK